MAQMVKPKKIKKTENNNDLLDWQDGCKKLTERIDKLFQTEQLSDCRFLVGDAENRKHFKAHKLILSISSSYFHCMFYGSLPEKANEDIVLDDVTPNAFEKMLRYIYVDEFICNSIEEAFEIFALADKCRLLHLMESCTKFIVDKLSATNVMKVHAFATFYNQSNLLNNALNYIVDRTEEVISNPTFLDCEVSLLMWMLGQNHLSHRVRVAVV